MLTLEQIRSTVVYERMARRFRLLCAFSLAVRVGFFILGLARYSNFRAEWQQLRDFCEASNCYSGDHLPLMSGQFKLLVAAAFLLLGRWWGNLVAFMISGIYIYDYIFLTMIGCATSNGSGVFSETAFECWLRIIAFEAPHLGMNLLFACAVFVWSAVSLVSFVARAERPLARLP